MKALIDKTGTKVTPLGKTGLHVEFNGNEYYIGSEIGVGTPPSMAIYKNRVYMFSNRNFKVEANLSSDIINAVCNVFTENMWEIYLF